MAASCVVLAVAAQAAAPAGVEIASPRPELVLPWGLNPPEVPLEAALQIDGRRQVSERLFLTARIRGADGRLLDRVALYDDGTHGDDRAGDGLFHSGYQPAGPGAYTVLLQAHWDGAGGGRETFSNPVRVHVERTPHPEFAWPHAGSNLGRKTTARVRLVQDEEVCRTPEPGARVLLLAEQAGRSLSPVVARPRGADWSAGLCFPTLGEWVLHARLEVQRQGQTVSVESPAFKVRVARPPRLWLALGSLLALAALLWRRSVPCWEQTVTLVGADGGELARVVLPVVRPPVKVSRTLGRADSAADVKSAAWTQAPLTITTQPGQKRLMLVAQEPLESQGRRSTRLRLAPGETAKSGPLSLRVLPQQKHVQLRCALWQFTTIKAASLAVGLVLAAFGWWQLRAFYNG